MSATDDVASGTIDAQRRDPFVLLPVFLAAAFIAAGNEDFGFDPAGWLDPFMYLGYFWHYPAHLPGLDHDYKASRLPWILPGYVIHALGGPAAASYVLVLVTLSAGGAVLYLLVRDVTRDRAAAAVTATAWTACTWVHGIGGWNYHMLAAADYFLAASWLTFRSARTGAASSAVLAGICAAAAIHTHLFFASFLPLLLLTYWSGLSKGKPGVHRFVRDSGRGAAGAVGITAVLAIVNATTGGDWLFFMPQVERARQLMQHDNWWLEARVWLPTATYLVAPLVFLLAALATLRRSGATEQRRPANVMVIQAWLALGIMCVAQFARRQATLNQGYLGFPLYVYAFPCVGVVLASGRARTRATAVVAASGVVIVAPLLLLMPETLPRAMSNAAAVVGSDTAVIPPLLFALIGGGLTLVAPGAARLLVFAGWFAVLNAWIAPAPSAYGVATPGYRRDMLELFHEVDGLTAAFDPRLDGIKYWFTDERITGRSGELSLGWVFDSYVSTRGWQANLLAHDPGVPLQDLTLDHLQRAVCIGVFASPGASAMLEAAVQAHFAALGKPLRRVTLRHLKRSDLAFDLSLLKPSDAPERRGPPCVRR